MNYDTMTIETLSDSVFRQSEFKVNKADLVERITYLIEKDRTKQLSIQDVSQQRELLIAYNIDFYKGIHDVDLKHIEANVDKYLSKL